MRSTTFEGLTLRITEKQYKQFKKRFNPDNFNHRSSRNDDCNDTPCICEEIKKGSHVEDDANGEHKTCRKCPFATPTGIGKCGVLFRQWCDINNLAAMSLWLNPNVLIASDPRGLIAAKAVYNELLSWKREVSSC